jgi:hypothetical protein
MRRTIAEEVALKLGISQEELIEKGSIAYLERELRLAEQEIANLRDRYNVSSPEQLEKLIGLGKIYSHPAWEDVIHWENTLHYMEKVKKLLEKIWAEVA